MFVLVVERNDGVGVSGRGVITGRENGPRKLASRRGVQRLVPPRLVGEEVEVVGEGVDAVLGVCGGEVEGGVGRGREGEGEEREKREAHRCGCGRFEGQVGMR